MQAHTNQGDAEATSIGFGGWVRYEQPKFFSGLDVSVRFADESGRLVATDLLIQRTRGPALTASLLRHIPLGRLEDMVNEEPTASSVRAKLDAPAPNLHLAIAPAFSEGTAQLSPDGPYPFSFDESKPSWLDRMLLAQLPDSEEPGIAVVGPVRLHRWETGGSLELEIPDSRAYGDAFYASVANAFSRAQRAHKAPAVAVAEANGVPVTTVNRWVREARARELMAPTRRWTTGG